MALRIDWADLPAAARAAIEARTGAVLAAEPIADGLTCAVAARLVTCAGAFFVKGVPVEDGRGRAAQRWELAVNPQVCSASPVLRWQVVADGWDLLVFDHVDGEHADLSRPADRELVAGVLQSVQGVAAPAGVPSFADRFSDVLDAGELVLLSGDALLHTDTNPHNLLVGAGRAWLVDWAMPAAGPAWVDVAYTAVRLLEADVSAPEALGWAWQFPSWRAADPAALEALVVGTCRQWESVVGAAGARQSNARFAALLGATVAVP
ncbi:aminoglycoside phosphotransferase [Streptomyces sp. NBC_01456]|uniref:aminoglycoside phosphotransferase n=1 Tax=Streptomyces sp. NBC_01456 TaxID=2975868 RepID=UPI002E3452A5|nr:aminoglycoside phosphotransferase [Streptomyces sp. NBC_01456]